MNKKALLEQEKNDLFNNWFRYIATPLLLLHAFCYYYFKHSVKQKPSTNTNETVTEYVYQSSDVGLVMDLKEIFPWLYLQGHSFCAVSSVLCILFQKELLFRVSTHKDERQRFNPLIWNIHKFVGYVILCCVFTMDVCGYLMGAFSNWPSFDIFSIYFASPWPFMILGVFLSAKLQLWNFHRFMSNMLFKACVVTPVARFAGAIAQRYHQFGTSDEYNYYMGIALVTLLASVWQLYDFKYFDEKFFNHVYKNKTNTFTKNITFFVFMLFHVSFIIKWIEIYFQSIYFLSMFLMQSS
ncbi:hypothetical protein RFI_09936 [Reticulomyxa filosa]|uniref:Uncharacterized protein n=1 Tax=Reticulomyxa filosa TaxID=46433 RepID=X6NLM7_RETFI|nr:hypothetical protein RFI_09936 [Reticulomyxa filosa]|eukprot:ETO27195.1 hypothetical protein RFI_09936 [Reticulomyxa filosa]